MATHIQSPTRIDAAGNKPKLIEEFIGRVNSGSEALSVAKMNSAAGWEEPGQTPEFDEYTVVLKGTLRVETKTGTFDVIASEAVIAKKGDWVRYSSPLDGGAEYVAICIPAFTPDTVHRDA